MRAILDSAGRTSLVAILLGLGVLAIAMALSLDLRSAGELGLRSAHVLAAMVWAGFIVFVNLVQHPAVVAAKPDERPILIRMIAAPAARVFTAAAHATLFTGFIMAIPIGASVHTRPLLIAGILGGLAMWAIVQFILRPNVARVTGKVAASDAEKLAARATIGTWARINLILVLPVTVAMLIAAHAGL